MNFTELSRIVGKKRKTVEQMFYLKGFSIKKPVDVKSYLHLVFRRRGVREKQPWRDVSHLKDYQYRIERRTGRTIQDWVAQPRIFGMTKGLAPEKQEVLHAISHQLFTTNTSLYGLIFAGSYVTGENFVKSERLFVLAVFVSGARYASQSERVKYSLSQSAEKYGIEISTLSTTLSALPMTLAYESNLDIRQLFNTGRIEYGWVSLAESNC